MESSILGDQRKKKSDQPIRILYDGNARNDISSLAPNMQGSIKTKLEVEDIDDLDSEHRRSANQLEIMDQVNSK